MASKLAAQQTIKLAPECHEAGTFRHQGRKESSSAPSECSASSLSLAEDGAAAAAARVRVPAWPLPAPPAPPVHPPQQPHLAPQSTEVGSDPDKFELTDDYIQQTIESALNSGNLTLEQQEKLINQLDGSDMPDTGTRCRAGGAHR